MMLFHFQQWIMIVDNIIDERIDLEKIVEIKM